MRVKPIISRRWGLALKKALPIKLSITPFITQFIKSYIYRKIIEKSHSQTIP
jgi:hypothetical protein